MAPLPPREAAQAAVPPPKTQHSRPRASSNANMAKRGGAAAAPFEPKLHYTVLIRLPFARGEFVDPAQVDWDATKDQALWKIISRPSSKTSEIDWQELAARFEVPPSFILQQAAWLYERHLDHVRKQMRKVGNSTTGAPIPVAGGSGTVSATGGVPMKRGGSGGAGPRTTSALSIRSRDSPVPGRTGAGTPGAGGAQISRTPSTTTITQSRFQPQSPRQPLRNSFRSSFPPPPRRASPGLETTAEASHPHSRTVSPTSPISESESSSSSDDEPNNPIRRSQVFKRPPRFTARPKKPALPRLDDVDIGYDEEQDYGNRAGDEGGSDEDEDDDEFLPFAQPSRRIKQQQYQDPSATLREQMDQQSGPSRNTDARTRPLSSVAAGKQPVRSHTMDSSATSTSDVDYAAAQQGVPRSDGEGRRAQGLSNRTGAKKRTGKPYSPSPTAGPPGGALSPHHRAELARLGSPRARREGSEGTPSMGSSFSDLDDASVTQSALEEQLLSHMQHAGGMSKMSTISQAFRSRYL